MPRSLVSKAAALAAAVLALFALVVLTGSADISVLESAKGILDTAGQTVAGRIVLQGRLPRALTALLAGGALAVAGLGMQTLLGNPLAGPFVLGVNAAATAGVAVLGLLLPALALSPLGASAAASVGSGAALLILLLLAARVGSILKLTIFGVLMGYGFAAVVTLALQLAGPRELSAFVGWTFGSFGRSDYRDILVLAGITVAGVVISFLNAKRLDALYLGPDEASLLGVSLRGLRVTAFFAAALLVGGVTAFCGPLAFIGIAAPHLARWTARSSRHRVLLGYCLLFGAVLALLAEVVSSVPGRDGRLPLNAVLSLMGIPIIASILFGLGGNEG